MPFPAGGPLDFTARLIAEKLAASMKQPFVVENRPGGAGNLGTDAVAKAAADGYTLLFVIDTPLTVNPSLYAKLPFDSVAGFRTDFDGREFSAQPGRASVSARELGGGIRQPMQERSRTSRCCTAAAADRGDPGHLAMEYFRMQAGFEAVHVPYKGNAEVVMGLVGGQIRGRFPRNSRRASQRARRPAEGARRLEPSAHAAIAPDVPTLAESGYPGFEVGFYQVMLAPAGIPESVRAVLEREIQDALQSPDLQERLRAQALEPIASTWCRDRRLA